MRNRITHEYTTTSLAEVVVCLWWKRSSTRSGAGVDVGSVTTRSSRPNQPTLSVMMQWLELLDLSGVGAMHRFP